MAYTKYSLTPADNNAAPPDGAPEGMLPSAVNDTMRDMMAQIRDVGDGIRGGTYTMTAPVITGGSISGTTFASGAATITGGSINGTTIGATTASTGSFTTLAYSSTLTGGTGIVNLGSGQFYKDSNGNVLVGTTSSLYSSAGRGIVEINGSSEAWLGLSTGGAGATYIRATGNELNIVNTRAGDTRFWTNNTEKMRITSAGNVGIGNSTPSYALDVASGLVRSQNTGGTYNGYLLTSNSGSAGARNYGLFSNYTAFGDFGIVQSNALGGDPVAAGTTRLYVDPTGNVGIGTSSPSASAILDVQSTTKGVRMPNMTTTQKNAISSPAAGLMVFDTTLAKLCVYSGSAWQTITSI